MVISYIGLTHFMLFRHLLQSLQHLAGWSSIIHVNGQDLKNLQNGKHHVGEFYFSHDVLVQLVLNNTHASTQLDWALCLTCIKLWTKLDVNH